MPPRILSGKLLPPQLAELEKRPERLYLHGQLPRGAGVAIVGKRHPTPEARSYARELASQLALEGVCIWSGGAEGIDTAAHEGALDVGGTTVVVAPAGYERPFPAENRELFRRAVESGGGYVSALSCKEPASQATFFLRNSILVALAHVLVVVEAGYRSGARNAAKWGRRLGRPLLVAPTVPWNQAGLGCLLEIKLGAQVLLSDKCVLAALRAVRAHPVTRPTGPPPVGAQGSLNLSAGGPSGGGAATTPRQKVIQALEAGASHADAIVQETGLKTAEVHALILTLTLEGVLAPDPAGGLKFVSRQYC